MTRLNVSIFIFVCVTAAQADTFLYQGMTSAHGTASIQLSGVPGGSFTKTVQAGESKFTYGNEAQTYGYCVDIFSPAGNGNAFKADTGSINGGLTIGYLINKYAPIYHASANKQGATALQLAIWDILYETPVGNIQATNVYKVNVATGNFKASNIKIDGSSFDPSSYFATFNSDLSGMAVTTRYVGHAGNNMQSFATAAPVPEPATLAALFVGAAGLWRRRRK